MQIFRINSALKGYAGKVVASSKSFIPDAGNAAWYGYAGKADTVSKSMIRNVGNAVPYG